MKKAIVATVIGLMLSVSLASSAEQAKIKIDNEVFTTGTAGGTWVMIGAGIAEKANEFFEGYPISAVPGPGSIGNPPRVAAKEALLGISYGAFLVLAENGKGPFKKKLTNLRSIASLTPTVFHFIIDKKIRVRGVKDLLDQHTPLKVAIPSPGSGSYMTVQTIFNVLGFEPDVFNKWGGKVIFGGGTEVSDSWKNRHADGMVFTLDAPASLIQEGFHAREGSLLEVEKPLRDELISRHGYSEFVIPKGMYKGIEKDVTTVAMEMVIFTRDDADPEVIYRVTKAIADNKDYLAIVHASLRSFVPEMMPTSLGISMHEGARKYYKEKGWIK